MSKPVYIVSFAAGVVVGSAITWQYFKKKYEQISQEEIDSVKAVFLKKEVESDIEIGKQVTKGFSDGLEKEKNSVVEYAAKLQKEGYVNYSATEDIGTGGTSAMDKPYVISPEEFGEFEEYEKISLIYYSDNILADENDELVENVEDVVGFESLTHFGEYEDDSVFVRNDQLKCDYEILMDQRLYSDVAKKMPNQVGV